MVRSLQLAKPSTAIITIEERMKERFPLRILMIFNGWFRLWAEPYSLCQALRAGEALLSGQIV